MKHIRLFLGLLGVLLFVCTGHAVTPESPFDLLKTENFNKLTIEQKVIVAIQLRHALVEIERSGGKDNVALREEIRRTLLDLALPRAEAIEDDEGSSWLCLRNGTFNPQVNGKCPSDIPQGNCVGSNRLCEETFFGPGICAQNTQGCEEAMKLSPFSDQRLLNYLKDPAHPERITKLREHGNMISARCLQHPSHPCDILMVAVNNTKQILKSDHMTIKALDIPYVHVPAVAGGGAVAAGGGDPALQPAGGPPAGAGGAAPPAAPPTTNSNPNQYTADEQAARDDIKSESGDVGKCNQWELSAEIFPDSHLADHPQLMTFEEAQTIMCEHKGWTDEQTNQIGDNLIAKLKMVGRKVNGKFECNNKNKASSAGVDCARVMGLANNMITCLKAVKDRQPDNNWAHAIATKPGVTVDEPNGGDGNAAVTVNFLAGYTHTDEVKLLYSSNPAAKFKGTYADAGVHPVINGKYLSSMLAIWKVPICDVRRNQSRGTAIPPVGASSNQSGGPPPGSADGAPPVHHHDGHRGQGFDHIRNGSPGSPPGASTTSTDADTTREPASTDTSSSKSDESGWLVPSLPQGAPGAGGHSTSGQGH